MTPTVGNKILAIPPAPCETPACDPTPIHPRIHPKHLRIRSRKGTRFEELILLYIRNEPAYQSIYQSALSFADWAARNGCDQRDTGIDLVATTNTGEVHAIQCKLYAPTHKIQKKDIDSFFTASGKSPFTQRIIVSSTNLWSDNAEDALRDQQIPVFKIDLAVLEPSVIDWSRYDPSQLQFPERVTMCEAYS